MGWHRLVHAQRRFPIYLLHRASRTHAMFPRTEGGAVLVRDAGAKTEIACIGGNRRPISVKNDDRWYRKADGAACDTAKLRARYAPPETVGVDGSALRPKHNDECGKDDSRDAFSVHVALPPVPHSTHAFSVDLGRHARHRKK